MADISKCANGETCILRLNCERYMVEPSFRQSYIAPPNPGKECEYYLSVDGSEYPEYTENET